MGGNSSKASRSEKKVHGVNLSEEGIEDFEKKRMLEWNQSDIRDWLKSIEFGEFAEEFRECVANGEELIKLRYQKSVSDVPFLSDGSRERKMFFVYILHLKNCVKPNKPLRELEFEKNFSMNFHQVLKKVSKIIFEESLGNFRIKNIENHCANLSDEQKCLKYLLNGRDGKDDEASLSGTLILCECKFSTKEHLKRKGATPFSSFIPEFQDEFGHFKVMIKIGSFTFLWDEDEIVIPKRGHDNGAITVLMDSDPVRFENAEIKFRDVKSKIASLIVRWNCHSKYSPKPSKRFEENSLDFIISLCSEIGVKFPFFEEKEAGVYSDFLRNMKKRRTNNLEFTPSLRFEKDFKLSNFEPSKDWDRKEVEEEENNYYKIVFQTHQELDDFLFHCYSTDPMLLKEYRDEFRLLKAFDRAFWLRHLNEKENKVYFASPKLERRCFGQQSSFHSGCPFADPRQCRGYANDLL